MKFSLREQSNIDHSISSVTGRRRCAIHACCLCVGLLWFRVAGGAVGGGTPQGAIPSERLSDIIDRTMQTPVKRETPLTFIVESNATADRMKALIASDGGSLRYHFGNRYEVRISADRSQRLLAHLPANSRARLPWPHQAVATTSQGVALTGASDMQSLGQTGAGLKIGVIDLQFSNYLNSINTGELPANTVFTDYTGTGSGGGNHGTNVAEIVHDMAPGAQLYLARIGTETQLQSAVNDMITEGVKVINHSVAWFGAAFYDGTGPLCDITKSAENAGILWVNAAGNYRNNHYLSTFTDTDGDLRHEFASGRNYNTMTLNQYQSVTLVLSWDAYPSTATDYDLYLYYGIPDSGGTVVASSTDNQSQGFSPYEQVDYVATTSGTYYIVLTKKNAATANLPLSLFSWGPSLGTKTTPSSLAQPADCASVLATGATDLSDAPEGFSSEGPTTDGRAKPEISAPDRVITSLSSGFAGTSAASPHAAGAAALVMAAHPGDPLTQVRNELAGTAEDVSTPGFDYRTGFGRISLDADGDGLNHDLESSIGTNPLAADSDNDGLTDYEEVAWDGNASSYAPGSDLNPLVADTDNDGLTDYQEVTWDSMESYTPGSDLNPLDADTDHDGFQDGMEHLAGYAPLDSASFPVWGDINDDRRVDPVDVLLASRAALGLLTLDDAERTRGKVAPLVNGTPRPAGNAPLNTADVLLIERKALGMVSY